MDNAVSKQPRILIVEDDPLLVKMYTTKFSREGFAVVSAQDGEEGLEAALNTPIDFMILDVMMPRLSGIDMLERLRANPKGKDIPAIVLTNLTQKEEAVKLQALGVKEYLVKASLTPSEVVEKVKQYLPKAA
jgi:DNA-binding response OmpR family regulator